MSEVFGIVQWREHAIRQRVGCAYRWVYWWGIMGMVKKKYLATGLQRPLLINWSLLKSQFFRCLNLLFCVISIDMTYKLKTNIKYKTRYFFFTMPIIPHQYTHLYAQPTLCLIACSRHWTIPNTSDMALNNNRSINKKKTYRHSTLYSNLQHKIRIGYKII
jgi:hypothetical protein